MSWFRSILNTFKAAQAQVGQTFIFEELGPANGVAAPARPIKKSEEYVTITVKSSRIVAIRRWTDKFYAAVHARTRYLHEGEGEVQVPTVLVPSLMKELDPRNLDRVITINQRVLGPVPYIGGLSLELGLFSVKGYDLASPYLDLLTSLAQACGTGFLVQALPFVAPLQKGFDLLFGNEQHAELEIGIEIEWPTVQTGTWVLMRAPQGQAPIASLQMHPTSFHLQDANDQPYRDYPYVVLSIEASRKRDDYMLIPELKQAWDALGAAAKAGDQADKLPGLLQRFNLACRWSPDLVPEDARRLQQKAREKVELFGDGRLAAQDAFGDLASLDLYDDRRPQ